MLPSVTNLVRGDSLSPHLHRKSSSDLTEKKMMKIKLNCFDNQRKFLERVEEKVLLQEGDVKVFIPEGTEHIEVFVNDKIFILWSAPFDGIKCLDFEKLSQYCE